MRGRYRELPVPDGTGLALAITTVCGQASAASARVMRYSGPAPAIFLLLPATEASSSMICA